MKGWVLVGAGILLAGCAEAAGDGARDLAERATDLASFLSGDLAQAVEVADLAGPPNDLTFSAQCTHIDEPLDAASASWAMAGSSVYDAVNHRIQLTPPSNSSAGTSFYSTPITSPTFDVKFKYYIGEGSSSGADGMAFVLAKAASVSQLGPPVAAASTLGYQGMTGYALELDTYKNANDPSANHVAWMDAATQTHIVVGEPAFPLNCGCERQVDIRNTGSQLTVTIDGTKLIDSPIVYNSDTYYFGFTAATGLINDRHAVRDVHVTMGPVGPCI